MEGGVALKNRLGLEFGGLEASKLNLKMFSGESG